MYFFDRRTARLTFVNLLTFSRLLAGLLTAVAFITSQNRFALITLIFYIWLTDMLDGIMARKWAVATRAGAIFDYVVDRFNYYLVIFLLIYAGVSPFLLIPFLLRDLAYISVQIYVGIPSIQGTKAASFGGTAVGYLYLLILKYLHQRTLIFDLGLFLTLCVSLGNLGLRIFRLRHRLIEQLKQDLILNVGSANFEDHIAEAGEPKLLCEPQVVSDENP